jgi:hypothetical protein
MTSTKWTAAAAITLLVAQSAIGAVRPSAARLSPATVSRMAAGTRIGTVARRQRSDILPAALVVVGIVAAAGAGVGVAAATGAIGGGKGKSTSP